MSSNNLTTLIDKQVLLHSLKRVALNGRTGVVLPTAADNPERVQVLLAESEAGLGDSKTISVNPTNLEIIDGGTDDEGNAEQDPRSDIVAADAHPAVPDGVDGTLGSLVKFVSIMGYKAAFPLRTRNKILELVGERQYHTIMTNINAFKRVYSIDVNNRDDILRLIQTLMNDGFVLISDEEVVVFLHDLGEDIYDMITDRSDHNSIDYHGLDINRDTVAEIETALRHYPGLLSRCTTTKWDFGEDGQVGWVEVDEGEGDLPIQCLISFGCCYASINVKAIPFIARFARLAIEFGSFQVHEKGGLLIQDNEHDDCDIVRVLVKGRDRSFRDEDDKDLIDTVCLAQLTELKAMGMIQGMDFPKRIYW